ncbi:primosomal protein, partial [Agromyces salentinus]
MSDTNDDTSRGEARNRAPRSDGRPQGSGRGANDARASRPAGDRDNKRPYEKREGGSSRPYEKREGGSSRPYEKREGGSSRPYEKRDGGSSRPYEKRDGGAPRSYGDRDNKRPYEKREGGSSRPYEKRDGGSSRPYEKRDGGSSRPYEKRDGGSSRPYEKREGGSSRPYEKRDGGAPRSYGDRDNKRPYEKREGGSSRPYEKRDGGAPRSYGDRDSKRPYEKRDGGSSRSYGDRDSKRPYEKREGGSSRPYEKREGGSSRPYEKRDGGAPRSYGDRDNKRPYEKRDGGSSRPYEKRDGGSSRPYEKRDGQSRPHGDRNDRRDSTEPRDFRRDSPGASTLAVRPHHDDPFIPETIDARDLDKGARAELKTLSKENADWVARHLVAASMYLDDDPELAHEHAQSAGRRAGRVAVVRETLAITAYATGDFALALRELRTYRRISGSNDQLPLMVDSERGVGRPDRALEVGRAVDRSELPAAVQVGLAIAMSGARLDLGQAELALAELEIPQLDPDRAFSYSPALFSAYAEVLDELGQTDDAAAWRARSARAEAALGGPELDLVEIYEVELEPELDGDGDVEEQAGSA